MTLELAGEPLCPRGHVSAEQEFCSVCGARMPSTTLAGTHSSLMTAATCPDCGTVRGGELGGVFCEICGFNYQTGGHGEIPRVADAKVDPAYDNSEESESSLQSAEAFQDGVEANREDLVTVGWQIAIQAGPGCGETSANMVLLDQATMLIGRANGDASGGPQLDLGFDDAISRRHALLQRLEDGRYVLRDLSSTNGTAVNGQGLPALADHVLAHGDRITLGHGTTLTITAVTL